MLVIKRMAGMNRTALTNINQSQHHAGGLPGSPKTRRDDKHTHTYIYVQHRNKTMFINSCMHLKATT